MNYKISRIEKNKIIIFSFIMSVLVILVHSINNKTIIENICSTELCQFAVPSFFIVSGFLFFINVDNIYILKNKIIKRIYTLFIPYIMWNVIYYLVNVIVKNNVTFSLNELYISAATHKYNPVYWYMEQLMYLTLLTPIIYILLKNKYVSYISYFLILLIIFFNVDYIFVNYDALSYYLFGAIVSRLFNEKIISIINKNYLIYLSVVFAIITLIRYAMIVISINDYNEYANIIITFVVLNRTIGAVFIFYLIDMFFDYYDVKRYMNNNFFLYSIHYLIVRIISNIYFIIFSNKVNINIYNLIGIIIYFSMPYICVFCSNKISLFMKKNTPFYYNILNGGRG